MNQQIDKPTSISRAEKLIYITIGASILARLVSAMMGGTSMDVLLLDMLVSALFCLIPYQIGKGYGLARHLYLGAVVIGVVGLFAGSQVPLLDVLLVVLTAPLQGYAIWLLFRPDSTKWFEKHVKVA